MWNKKGLEITGLRANIIVTLYDDDVRTVNDQCSYQIINYQKLRVRNKTNIFKLRD